MGWIESTGLHQRGCYSLALRPGMTDLGLPRSGPKKL